MGMYLSTVNKEASDEIMNPTPLPEIGSSVVYCPRPGEVRAGKKRVPALVIGRDVDNGLLDLVVIYDADDFLSKRRIPRRMGEDQGWEPSSDSATAVLEKLETFKSELAEVLFWNHAKPTVSVLDRLDNLATRLAVLENRPRVGRPPNAKPAESGED